MKTILLSFIAQLLPTAGSVVAAGLFICCCKKLFVIACGSKAYAIVNYSGLLGTPVHELSHALLCLLFGHKITDIKLFGLDKTSGTLGYVKHAYNKRNIYQRIGNFFIGVAPVIAGSGVLLLLLRLLVPALYTDTADALAGAAAAGELTVAALRDLLLAAGSVFRLTFDPSRFGDWRFWVFLLLAMTISIHMELSAADVKGGWDGFLFYAGTLLLVDVVLFLVSPDGLSAFTAVMIKGGFYLSSLLLLSAVFSAAVAILSLPLLLFRKIF